MTDAIPNAAVTVAAVPMDAVLLDVREDDEWAAGHAPGAVHLAMSGIQARIDELPDAPVLHVVCRAGGRSAQVTEWLNQQGRTAINVQGGMQEWARSGREMVSESAAAPRVL